jgi:hypothetical protein
MTDKSKTGYWIPTSMTLEQMDRAILSCDLPLNQEITQAAIMKGVESKLVHQMTELGKADLIPTLEAHSQSLAELASDLWTVAEELMSPVHQLISQLDLAKESLNWKNQTAPVDKAEVLELSQDETLEQLLNA